MPWCFMSCSTCLNFGRRRSSSAKHAFATSSRQRAAGFLFEQLASAFRHETERVDGVPNFHFVGGNASVEHVTRNAILVIFLFPSPFGIVAGDRDQHHGKALRQKLPQAGAVQWI